MNEMECKCCNHIGLEPLYEAKDRLHDKEGEFMLYSCLNCGVVTVRPELTNEMAEFYYPGDYICYPVPINQEKSAFKRFDRKFGVEKRRKKVEMYTSKSGGRILDIGCATGVFLREMQDYGWEAYGVEPSKFASDIAINQQGLNVYQGYLKEGLFTENFFDVITLWDVFEHLPNPVETLQEIKKILKADGYLVITTPNSNSWERKIFEQYWVGWEVPRHFNIFSEASIIRLLDAQGFQIEKLISFTGMLGAIRLSMYYWLQDSKFSENSKRFIKWFVDSGLFRFILYPYIFASKLFSKSTDMSIFASIARSKRG